MLGPVDLTQIPDGIARHNTLTGEYIAGLFSYDDLAQHLDWIIVGGETGPGKRPMAPNWARRVRDQCIDAGVPFFFKQDGWGSHLLDGQEWHQWPR